MRFKSLAVALVIILTAGSLFAQEVYFGKNKVRYKDFDWSYIQTRHFDIHFYEDAYPTAKFAATVLESSYTEVTGELDYLIQRRVPVFVYNSHNDFQQTNIIPDILPEGVGGFTEVFKNRLVVPFNGSYEEFRHVLHHELTHAIIYDLLYGRALSSLISRQRFFSMPLWLAEGFAEYSSRHGWDYWSDMVVRDATINGYLAPPWALGGFLAYKEGQAMVKYIADKYGEEKIGELIRNGKRMLSINRALKQTLGVDEKEFWEEFSKEMKRRYWPEIAERLDADEFAKQLTKARKDGSYFNEHPTYSPRGESIAIYTDKSDYTEIVLISPIDGKRLRGLVKAARSGDLESLHSYVSGLSFSPDGSQIVFAAKSGGNEVLVFYDVDRGKTIRRETMDYYNIVNPVWSPDGNRIVFSALKGIERCLFAYDVNNDSVEQLTDDRYDDISASWLPDGSGLVFSSDRPHPSSTIEDPSTNLYVDSSAFMPGDFKYGHYNLFQLDLATLAVLPLDVGPGQNKNPAVSPDGSKVAFLSNRNGIDNLYIAFMDSTRYFAATDILGGIKSFSWAPDGKEIVFEAFHKGAFDIFILKELAPAGDDGVLQPTAFVLGEYDLLKPMVEDDQGLAKAADSMLIAPDETVDTLAQSEDSTALAATDDSTTIATAPEPEVVDTTTTGTDDSDDEEITTTGIYDDEFVYVSPEPGDPLDSLLMDVSDSTLEARRGMTEPASFDSIPMPAGGEYTIRKYKTKFTPDFVGGGFAYDTFFGLRGQTYFVFSDLLGNHQIYVATDLVNTIDQSFIQAAYFYNKRRVNLGFGFFHTKNFYLDNFDFLFSDRFYGFQAFATRPFSTFSRFDLTLSQYFIDREYLESDLVDPREDRSSKVTTAELSYTTDNIVWGLTGPVNGRRTRIAAEYGKNLFDSKDIDFSAFSIDLRKYIHLKNSFGFAFRLAAGASFGSTPKRYFLGGTTNWIGNRTLDAEVYEVENLYFADVVTPLRGVEYYDLSGNRYGLFNFEFRYPMIDYFIMRFPLRLAITNVKGAIFFDMGTAFDDDQFKFGTSQGGTRLLDVRSGFGFGMRANLGFLLLRYDLAWATDFNGVADKPTYYFSFGADF